MPRKGNVPKREVLPDPVYGSVVVAKLINSIMVDGKKGVAQSIVYGAVSYTHLPNIGLIGSLTTYGIVDEYGFIETPYRVVDKETHRVTEEIHYITCLLYTSRCV